MRPLRTDLTLIFTVMMVLTGWVMARQAPEETLEAEMQALAAAAAPGEHHEHLAVLEGAWTARARFLSTDGGQPLESTTEAQNEMILGGRFLKTVHSGELMGQPLLGLGYDGYDNSTEQHESIWFDNLGTGMLFMRGSCGQEGRRITTYGEMVDPADGTPRQLQSVTTIHNSRMYTVEMSEKDKDGNYVKTFEVVLTKK